LLLPLDGSWLPAVLSLLSQVHALRVASRSHRGRWRALRMGVEQDLHTPLVALTHGLQRLPRTALGPAERNDLETLTAAARGILRRSHRLRQPSGEGSRPGRPNPQAVAIRPLLNEAALHTASNRALFVFDPPESDPEVRLDPAQFRRAMEQLLTNVRQHAVSLVQVLIRVEGDRLVVEVSDRGLGLDVADPKPSEPTGGGLAWCRASIEAQGGELSFRALTDGLTVRAVWPGVVDQRFDVEVLNHAEHHAPEVWLADADAEVCATLVAALNARGLQVSAFPHGDALLMALADAEQLPAVVVVDAELPGGALLSVLQAVRDLAPGVRRVIHSEQAPSAEVVEAFNLQLVNRFLRKNANLDDIAAILHGLSDVDAYDPLADQQRLAFDDLLSHRRLTLHVQPMFCTRTGRLVAVEALLRSLHPGFRGPQEVLEASRACGREVALHRVLARLARTLVDQLPPDVDLFFNLDPVVLARPVQLDAVFRVLDPVAHRVVLELTERARLDDVSDWLDAVLLLRAKGYRMALDDVGAGYNSLGMVTAIRPDVLKLDISLVSGAPGDPVKQGLIRLLVQFAEGQGMTTVAEGIERDDEATICRDLGVSRLQGFLLARPMPLEQALSRFAAHLPGADTGEPKAATS
jgi:EAL domain-containing protein (putative c-di-GMP-specific phosphodiesterase class I)